MLLTEHYWRQGKSPTGVRRAERANTIANFECLAREWLELKREAWTPYYARQVERALELNVFPHIGALLIEDIGSAHLLAVLAEVEKRGAKSVLANVRYWCSAIFRHAVSTRRTKSDPSAALTVELHGSRPASTTRKHTLDVVRPEVAPDVNASATGHGPWQGSERARSTTSRTG